MNSMREEIFVEKSCIKGTAAALRVCKKSAVQKRKGEHRKRRAAF